MAIFCTYDKSERACVSPILPGTVATIRCSNQFESPIGRDFNTELECRFNDQWSARKPVCEMLCGQVTPDVTEFAKGGANINITKTPWHVGIYDRSEEDMSYEFRCGGTIISPFLVLSGGSSVGVSLCLTKLNLNI